MVREKLIAKGVRIHVESSANWVEIGAIELMDLRAWGLR
jgi:hypothetical protein